MEILLRYLPLLLLFLVALYFLCRPSPKAVRFSEIQANPALHHSRTIHSKIRGVTHRNDGGSWNRQTIIRANCKVGDALALVREPQNPVDARAIKVCRIVHGKNGREIAQQLGYVAHELAEDLTPKLDGGAYWMIAKITALTGDVSGWAARSVGVNIEIEVFRPSAPFPASPARIPSTD